MNTIHLNDGILRPFTYEDAAILLRNVNPERGDVWQEMKKDLYKWARENINEMMYDLDQHKDEVWTAAYPDEPKPLRNHPDWDFDRVEALSKDIYTFLVEREMWIDVCLYYNGKRMLTDSFVNGKYRIEEDKDPRDYFEYVTNPHILSMSFEGPVCHALSYGTDPVFEREFNQMLADHGVWYELGNHWNLSLNAM